MRDRELGTLGTLGGSLFSCRRGGLEIAGRTGSLGEPWPWGALGWGWGFQSRHHTCRSRKQERGPAVTGTCCDRQHTQKRCVGPPQPRKPGMNSRWMTSDGLQSDLRSVCGSRPSPSVLPGLVGQLSGDRSRFFSQCPKAGRGGVGPRPGAAPQVGGESWGWGREGESSPGDR